MQGTNLQMVKIQFYQMHQCSDLPSNARNLVITQIPLIYQLMHASYKITPLIFKELFHPVHQINF